MAIATGTAVVIGAGIAAAGGVGAAKLQSNANKRALASQDKAGEAALAHAREREGIEDKRYSAREQEYLTDLNAWRKRHPEGYDASGGGGGGGEAASVPVPTLADLNASQQDVSAAQASQPTLADLGQWNDWRRYGA